MKYNDSMLSCICRLKLAKVDELIILEDSPTNKKYAMKNIMFTRREGGKNG